MSNLGYGLMALFLAAVLAAYWMLILSPKRVEAK